MSYKGELVCKPVAAILFYVIIYLRAEAPERLTPTPHQPDPK